MGVKIGGHGGVNQLVGGGGSGCSKWAVTMVVAKVITIMKTAFGSPFRAEVYQN
jgi:hypothetical protein